VRAKWRRVRYPHHIGPHTHTTSIHPVKQEQKPKHSMAVFAYDCAPAMLR
jgi:hypothetical protein